MFSSFTLQIALISIISYLIIFVLVVPNAYTLIM